MREGTALAAVRGLARRLEERARAGLGPPVLAVVHGWSTHDLLLRTWLAAGGIDPDRDTVLTVVPPADMVAALAEGRIDGFCAGAPWGAVAVARGLGETAVLSSAIWRDHPEKCLAVSAPWAEADPARLQALLGALLAAAALCDDPLETPGIAALLSGPAYVDAPVAAIAASLPGGVPGAVDRSVFRARNASVPRRSEALWFLAQMARWGAVPADLDAAAVAARVYRPDLHPEADRLEPDAGNEGERFFYLGRPG
jgi:NitT/TauT family transport system ATP-binding protein/nitrate/nitrite transport system substrate-binding protein